jgi:hypothetical protein
MDAEISRAVLNLAVSAATLGLTWFVGSGVAARWAEFQKKREFELALANTFYSNYGEFRAVWRLWNRALLDFANDKNALEKARESLLGRACQVEGGLEAVLLKVASERVLNSEERINLGNLRQAFQQLRERIEAGVPISYGASQNIDYQEFKRLATYFGTMIASRPSREVPSNQDAYKSFEELTHNKYEGRWKNAGKSHNRGDY